MPQHLTYLVNIDSGNGLVVPYSKCYYPNQGWLSFMTPYGVTWSKWVNIQAFGY